ncbi:hypothetical protein [Pseudomonas nitroreducens]|uniref:hypothetical protein n=1 Tax=Pseudomonas nitroreducens TaxID=46680 RepID=UPI00147D45C6|nr:hypothetical protein [Pseudomonas nitroreducens]NNN24330.1 hypothetical protein [Pseudomonas nitroreducens]
MKRTIALLGLLLAGCVAKQQAPEETGVPIVKNTYELTQQALEAYQHGDKDRWSRLLCQKSDDAPLTGWKPMRRLVGDITDIRLVRLSEATKAGNSFTSDLTTEVVYEVQSEKYPLRKLLLKFFAIENPACIGLVY